MWPWRSRAARLDAIEARLDDLAELVEASATAEQIIRRAAQPATGGDYLAGYTAARRRPGHLSVIRGGAA